MPWRESALVQSVHKPDRLTARENVDRLLVGFVVGAGGGGDGVDNRIISKVRNMSAANPISPAAIRRHPIITSAHRGIASLDLCLPPYPIGTIMAASPAVLARNTYHSIVTFRRTSFYCTYFSCFSVCTNPTLKERWLVHP